MLEHSSKNIHDGVLFWKSHMVRLLKQVTNIGIFQKNVFQKISKAHRICDAFLVFDRKVLLCGISEPAINRNSEEHLL